MNVDLIGRVYNYCQRYWGEKLLGVVMQNLKCWAVELNHYALVM